MTYKRKPKLIGITTVEGDTRTEHPPTEETYYLMLEAVCALEEVAILARRRKENPRAEDDMTPDDYEWFARDREAKALRLRELCGMSTWKRFWKTKHEIFGDDNDVLKSPEMR